MKSVDDKEYVISRLKQLLSSHDKTVTKTRRLIYTGLPLNTDLKLDHVQLSNLLVPKVSADPFANEALLDSWLYAIDGSVANSIADIAGEDFAAYVEDGVSLEEQTIRLLFACGKAEGATMTIGPNTLMVDHGERSFGLDEGQIVSRFCSHMRFPDWNPSEIITRRPRVGVSSAYFCSLYREAYKMDVLPALLALHSGNRGFNFRVMAAEMRKPKSFTTRELNAVEKILGKKDPIAKLYRYLVPQWMTKSEFSRRICDLSTRVDEPSLSTIQRVASNVVNFFKNRNKK